MIEGLFRVRCTVSWHLVEDVWISYSKDTSELTASSFSIFVAGRWSCSGFATEGSVVSYI